MAAVIVNDSNTPPDAGQPAEPTPRRRDGGGRVSRSIVALSSAAVLAVYSAGYLRTQAAADRFAAEADQRRPSMPAQPAAVPGPDVIADAGLDQPPADIGPAVANATPAVDEPQTTTRQQPPTPAPSAPPAAAPAVPVDVAASKNTAPGDTAATEVTTAALGVSATPAPAQTVAAAVQTEAPVAATATAAAAPSGPDAPATAAAASKYKDGTYTGWGTSRHGDIQAQVIIVDGRITSATIAQCMTRWPCSWIEALPPQVVQRQSPETDFVSGATQSTNAFYYGVVQALGKAALP